MTKRILEYLKRGPASIDDLKARFGVTAEQLYRLYQKGLLTQNEDNQIELAP